MLVSVIVLANGAIIAIAGAIFVVAIAQHLKARRRKGALAIKRRATQFRRNRVGL